jgi:guanylate cyclase
MESHGSSGRIQITRATKELLENEFVCEPRGTISVKGKGEMEAWYLVGRRASPATESRDRFGDGADGDQEGVLEERG